LHGEPLQGRPQLALAAMREHRAPPPQATRPTTAIEAPTIPPVRVTPADVLRGLDDGDATVHLPIVGWAPLRLFSQALPTPIGSATTTVSLNRPGGGDIAINLRAQGGQLDVDGSHVRLSPPVDLAIDVSGNVGPLAGRAVLSGSIRGLRFERDPITG